jgi:N6-L-threonylcarbamoyladenine synthase
VILAIETSCDETCAAVVDGRTIRSNIVASQVAFHERFGGVVPEIASRRHLELLPGVVDHALYDAGVVLGDCRAVAVTTGPGLIGALLVGVAAAKAYAYAAGRPLIGVDHLHGHVASLFAEPSPLEPPFLCLLASGGHTMLLDVADHRTLRVLGRSLDDAAGEAFDKGARLLGLGYPGGPALERLATAGDPARFPFGVAMQGRPGFDFSFSGLKTALLYRLRDGAPEDRADLAASYQEAIVASLAVRLEAAVEATGARRVGIVGGVAANGRLRAVIGDLAHRLGIETRAAPLALCSDNAAMIGLAAGFLEPLDRRAGLELDARARTLLGVESA